MGATQTARRKKTPPPSFETVWAALQKTDKLIKENAREADRRLKDTAKEYDRQIKDLNKRFGDFTNRFGEVVEHMIAPNLCDKFIELGHDFPRSSDNMRFKDRVNDIYFEVDYFLENYKKAILVEVKTKLFIGDVKDHIKRLEKMRKYADLHDDNRTFFGAVAGVVISPHVKEYALKQGLFIVEPAGETFNITPPEGEPREW